MAGMPNYFYDDENVFRMRWRCRKNRATCKLNRIGVAGEKLEKGVSICYDIFDGKIYMIRPKDQILNSNPIPYRLCKEK